jgi:hypothetical protein
MKSAQSHRSQKQLDPLDDPCPQKPQLIKTLTRLSTPSTAYLKPTRTLAKAASHAQLQPQAKAKKTRPIVKIKFCAHSPLVTSPSGALTAIPNAARFVKPPPE